MGQRTVTSAGLVSFLKDRKKNPTDNATYDKQEAGTAEVDVHVTAKQYKEQTDDQESEQAAEATFDEGGRFGFHGNISGRDRLPVPAASLFDRGGVFDAKNSGGL
jgi:hypothetical protein